MRSTLTTCALLCAAAAPAVFAEDATKKLPPVKALALQKAISKKALSTKAHELEDLAYSTPGRNRVMGSEGHNSTVAWITGYLDEMSDFYTYEVQPFIALYSDANGTATADGDELEAEAFEYSPSGDVEADIVAVDNLGCEASDYPDEVDGAIALISRGECEFGLKTALAGGAGAVAAIIYNNEQGLIGGGTLGPPPRPEGEYVPVVGVARRTGNQILNALEDGAVTGTVTTVSDIHNVTTYNVIAETICGDHDNVLTLGAHSDSVIDGPGLNDDGSGTIGILEAAIQLSSYSTNNAVRFCWWSGEEFGLLGSTHYVETLNDTAGALDKIKLYLNFDMLASPNYIFATFDGDGSTFNLTGPPGSAEVETFYRQWFKRRGLNITATAFDGRSDYQAFADNGIPCGGLFAGADETKTPRLFKKFGGEQGETLDPNYHSALDNYDNLNFDAWVPIEKALVASIAEYATSFDSLPSAKKVRARGIEDGKLMRRALEDRPFVRRGHAKVWKV
ncbi:uncharacterized protein LTR77_010100 [Saxophila tyrrhenica]|uniref:Peptide hydrolase n=1 Tax=Saxophila tyrrhenica TaxID=1690608 RepID=A0AAV9NYP0_9PEZI|nr:hypothetical protein LTR77_010100 [Saxophila tyrrhenica]